MSPCCCKRGHGLGHQTGLPRKAPGQHVTTLGPRRAEVRARARQSKPNSNGLTRGRHMAASGTVAVSAEQLGERRANGAA